MRRGFARQEQIESRMPYRQEGLAAVPLLMHFEELLHLRDHSLQGHIHRRSIPRRPSRAEEGKQAAAHASSPGGKLARPRGLA